MNYKGSIFFGSVMAIFGVLLIIYLPRNFSFTIHSSTDLKKHRVLLVILDALRHDYLEITKARNIDLRNLHRMASSGARSMQAVPVYPSVTFPNHQALVTGLYAPYHGITHNNFNDSSMGYEQFSMDNQTSLNEARWYTGYPDPIWVSCEKSRYCKSGSMLYPNTDALFNGYRPFRYVGQYTPLNQQPNVIYPYDRRVDEMIGWMKNDFIDFGLLYFDEPDATSHANGPLDNKTLSKLKEMDNFIGRLFNGLEKEGLLDQTDILVTGDHGMTEMSLDRVIQIDDFVDKSWYKSTYSFPVDIIYPNEGRFDDVFRAYSLASPHIKVYKREDLPSELHYSDNVRRISPIVTVVELGWFVNCSHVKKDFIKGNHGYSTKYDDMKATMLAMGPSFRNAVINTTHHVDLYPLIMHLLGLKANPHNGSLDAFSSVLTQDALKFRSIEDNYRFNVVFILVFVMVLLQLCISLAYVAFLANARCRSKYSSDEFGVTYRKQDLQ